MTEEKLLACPFCGSEESERDGIKGTKHAEDCYIILMETELPNSPLRIMAWNRRAGGRQTETSETGGTKAVGSSAVFCRLVDAAKRLIEDERFDYFANTNCPKGQEDDGVRLWNDLVIAMNAAEEEQRQNK